MKQSSDFTWTGERYVPGVSGEVALEHLHRYALAARLAHGKRVLDVACGEGYGSYLMAANAESVTGVDLDVSAVMHASARYSRSNLVFLDGDCTALPLSDDCVDLVVSLETLEHHARHEAMLAELRRVLTHNGVLLISTPDRKYYSDARAYSNPFHVRELYASEFRQLIHDHFTNAVFYDQRIVFGSLIAAPDGREPLISYTGDNLDIREYAGISEPLYMLAVVSNGPVPDLPASLFDGTIIKEQEFSLIYNELASTRMQLEAVYASIYWRITLPLRLLRKIFKRFLGI